MEMLVSTPSAGVHGITHHHATSPPPEDHSEQVKKCVGQNRHLWPAVLKAPHQCSWQERLMERLISTPSAGVLARERFLV